MYKIYSRDFNVFNTSDSFILFYFFLTKCVKLTFTSLLLQSIVDFARNFEIIPTSERLFVSSFKIKVDRSWIRTRFVPRLWSKMVRVGFNARNLGLPPAVVVAFTAA